MKPLPKTFRKSGFDFEQLKRIGNVALYRKTNGNIESFELVKVQAHDGYFIKDVEMPPAEFYPSSEQWGTNGWTFTTRDEAELMFQKLAKGAI